MWSQEEEGGGEGHSLMILITGEFTLDPYSTFIGFMLSLSHEHFLDNHP